MKQRLKLRQTYEWRVCGETWRAALGPNWKYLALLADHDYRQLLVSGTFEPHGNLNPEAYRRYVESELASWTPIVRTLGLKID
jgi:hypothetical protein